MSKPFEVLLTYDLSPHESIFRTFIISKPELKIEYRYDGKELPDSTVVMVVFAINHNMASNEAIDRFMNAISVYNREYPDNKVKLDRIACQSSTQREGGLIIHNYD